MDQANLKKYQNALNLSYDLKLKYNLQSSTF